MEAMHLGIGEILAFRTGRFKPKDTMKKSLLLLRKGRSRKSDAKKDTAKINEGIGIPMPSKI